MAIFRILKLTIIPLLLLGGFAGEAFSSYANARNAFMRRDYPTAAAAYFNVYSAPRNRAERMKSEWGLAQSLQKLGLNYSASKYYSIIVRRGRKASNPFFRKAMEELGRINSQVSLGQAHVVQLFKAKVSTSDVPGPARGFYFYYKGIEAFNQKKLERARGYFAKVPSGSSYSLGARFHLGVIANLSGGHSRAINYFERVLGATGGREHMREIHEAALMNIARVYYEKKRFPEAINYYGRIPRNSDYWLDAIWETSWAFFFMQKFNNSLGQMHTIHSPFFEDRFYPETYILQAITFLRLCRYGEVKKSMRLFKRRYAPVFKEIKSMLNRYRGNPRGFFKLVHRYRVSGRLGRYSRTTEIVKKLSGTDAYKEARDTVRFSERELEALSQYRGKWSSSGLRSSLKSFLRGKKSTAISDAGRRMYKLGTVYYTQLLELSNQTKMIVAEMQLGKLAKLRSQISAYKEKSRVEFIGGMQKLNIGQSLEYWPFEKEYWEDELGFYVYNMGSRCSRKKK